MTIEYIATKYRRTGSSESDVFHIGDRYYYIDLSAIPFYGTECMIFRANKLGKVTNWLELYCRRGIPISRESLEKCAQEFADEVESYPDVYGVL